MKLTSRDPNQIHQFEHDDKNNAKRVYVVGQELNIDSSKVAESLEKAVLKGLSNIKLTTPQSPSYTPREIEKTVFIPQVEYKTVEIPVIVKEIEYREIERPIIIEKIVTIEKPVIIKETEIKYIEVERNYPIVMKITAVIQAVCVMALLLSNLLSHLK